VKSKLIDNYQEWSDEEKKNFTLRKETKITRLINNEVINKKEEDLPDKEKIKEELDNSSGKVPSAVQLVQRVSLTYNLRKRIKTGV
jgi:hypothetical protein